MSGAAARHATSLATGMLTATQLRAAGGTLDVADREVRAARWQRVARGTYAVHGSELDPAELAQAAVAYVRAPCVVTGLVAAHLLGLRWVPPAARVHVLVDDRLRRPSSGLVLVTRTAVLADVPCWLRDGVAVAAPERAVVDASRACTSLRDARGVVLGAVRDSRVTLSGLSRALEAGRSNGSGQTRRALVDAERGCASPPEAELVDGLVGRGRAFLVNPELWRDGVLLGQPDIWIVGTDVGGEVESEERHGGTAATESTYDRHERFGAADIELVHLSVRRVRRNPQAAADQLLSRSAGRTAPPDLVVRPHGPVLR